jgi:hypothetical protein
MHIAVSSVSHTDIKQWIDICCIDKTSSAELSEAVNSMFKWYDYAEIRYVYLSDVLGNGDVDQQWKEFANSRWFNRGWTLQELISPTIVIFVAQYWTVIGSRSSLLITIAQTTGIDRDLFSDGLLSASRTLNHNRLTQYSVAQKMSWASKRQIIGVEDETCCLPGIFCVNMPLLYGEGKMPFIRLQKEIINRSSDHSIFAWNNQSEGINGFLTNSTDGVAGCSAIIEVLHATGLSPYGVTNKGHTNHIASPRSSH